MVRSAHDRRTICAIDGDVEPTPAERLRRAVEAHVPHDLREESARIRFLAELRRLAEPFDEDADPVHVTASSVVVGTRGTILHLHKRLQRWLQPGGHVDKGETTDVAALRESFEETGLDLAHPPDGPLLFHIDVHGAAQRHVHLDVRYLLLTGDADPAPLPGESPAVRWFAWDEAEGIADPGLVGALRVARDLVTSDGRVLAGPRGRP